MKVFGRNVRRWNFFGNNGRTFLRSEKCSGEVLQRITYSSSPEVDLMEWRSVELIDYLQSDCFIPLSLHRRLYFLFDKDQNANLEGIVHCVKNVYEMSFTFKIEVRLPKKFILRCTKENKDSCIRILEVSKQSSSRKYNIWKECSILVLIQVVLHSQAPNWQQSGACIFSIGLYGANQIAACIS